MQAPGHPTYARPRPHEASDLRGWRQLARPATRPRARPPAPGGRVARLSRRRHGLSRKAQARLHGPVMEADVRAKAAAEVMWRDDNASKWLGMKVEEVRPG